MSFGTDGAASTSQIVQLLSVPEILNPGLPEIMDPLPLPRGWLPVCLDSLPPFPWPHVPGVEMHDAKSVAQETVARYVRGRVSRTVGRPME